jgi:hypothetical protein
MATVHQLMKSKAHSRPMRPSWELPAAAAHTVASAQPRGTPPPHSASSSVTRFCYSLRCYDIFLNPPSFATLRRYDLIISRLAAVRLVPAMESILRSLLGRPALNTLLDALIACRAPLPLRDLLAVCHASSGCVPALSDSESCSIYRWDGVPPYSCSTNRKDVLGTGTWGTFPSLGYQGQECNVLHKD